LSCDLAIVYLLIEPVDRNRNIQLYMLMNLPFIICFGFGIIRYSCLVVGTMAVEVVGFEMVQGPVENGAEGAKPVSHEKENGKLEKEIGAVEAIKFGSHGDESAKGNDVSEANVPRDAAEEWPAPKQIHSYYFVRWRPYEDPTIKSKIDSLDKEITKKNQARFQITEALKAKRVS